MDVKSDKKKKKNSKSKLKSNSKSSPKPNYMVKLTKNKKKILSPDGLVCSKNYQK